jgi:hypothetical protein
MMRPFTIKIGDWSGDGHGKCDDFRFKANKPIEDVREAYFAAKKRYPKLCPEKFCAKYEDSSVPPDVRAGLRAAGCPLRDDASLDGECLSADEMAKIVAWFIGQGDSDLVVVPNDEEPVPMLAFYGDDKKKRHIGFIGYGLFI